MPVLLLLLKLVLLLALAPLLEGVVRKLRAIAGSRQGPPLWQGYLDLAKLFGKEDLRVTGSWLYRAAPPLSLASIGLAGLMVPLLVPRSPLEGAADAIVFIYLLGVLGIAVTVVALASESPFAYLGASREVMMLLSVEPVVAVALIVLALKAGTFSLGAMANWHIENGLSVSTGVATLAFAIALQAQVGKRPFDITEAESEIIGGPLAEVSGPSLALFHWALYTRQLVFVAVLTEVFLPWPRAGIWPLDALISVAKILLVVALIGLTDALMPRVRIDQSMTYYSRVVIFVATLALALAVMGA